jgi:hypothetical protein
MKQGIIWKNLKVINMDSGIFSNEERMGIEDVLRYLALEFYQQAEYIKGKNGSASDFNSNYEAGVLFAYSEVLETIRIYAKANDIDNSNIGLDEIKPYSVMSFRPMNWPEDKKLI